MKMAVNLIFGNQPPYVALSYRVKSRHMVVFLTAEIVLLPQGMINPRFFDRGHISYTKLFCFCMVEQNSRAIFVNSSKHRTVRMDYTAHSEPVQSIRTVRCLELFTNIGREFC